MLSEGFVKCHPCPDPWCIYNVTTVSFLPEPLFFRYSFHSFLQGVQPILNTESVFPGELPRDTQSVGQVLLCLISMAHEANVRSFSITSRWAERAAFAVIGTLAPSPYDSEYKTPHTFIRKTKDLSQMPSILEQFTGRKITANPYLWTFISLPHCSRTLHFISFLRQWPGSWIVFFSLPWVCKQSIVSEFRHR